MSKTNARIANLLRSTGKISESEFLAFGFTQAEIDAAVKSGAVNRSGNQMGPTTLRYLSAK